MDDEDQEREQITLAAMLGERFVFFNKLKCQFCQDAACSDISFLTHVKELAAKLTEQTSKLMDKCNSALTAGEQINPPRDHPDFVDRDVVVSRDPADRRELWYRPNGGSGLTKKCF